MTKILVTGAAGFVGSHLVEHLLKNTDWEIVTLDRFDAAGNPNRLSDMLENTQDIDRSRVRFVYWDLKAELNDQVKKQLNGPFDYIAHLAAGSHVDRSIEDPLSFFMDNCIGTVNLLNYARPTKNEHGHWRAGGLKAYTHGARGNDLIPYEIPKVQGKFLYFSTDEVFGPAPFEMKGGYKEWDRHNPNNPYAAAKSAAEMAVISFANTYQLPCVITNCMNIFGERQATEKFVPLIIKKTLDGGKLFIHANKDKTRPGMRHYLHARNICAAVLWVLENGNVLDGSAKNGRYNVVGEQEVDNLELAHIVEEMVNAWQSMNGIEETHLETELVDFHSSRPGHDLRYALDGVHLKESGFEYPVDFLSGLRKMVYWTLDNKDKWL